MKDDAIAVREFVADDLDAVVAFSLRAWEPVFTSLHAVLGDEIFFRLHPNWRESQAEAVRCARTNDARHNYNPRMIRLRSARSAMHSWPSLTRSQSGSWRSR